MPGLNPIPTLLFLDSGILALSATILSYLCFGVALVAASCRWDRTLVRFLFWGWVFEFLVIVAASVWNAWAYCPLPYEFYLLCMYNAAVRAVIAGLFCSLVISCVWLARENDARLRQMIKAGTVLALLGLAVLVGLNRWFAATFSLCDFRPAPPVAEQEDTSSGH